MRRFTRIALLAVLAALVVPALGTAATRMPVGFQDDPTFRWSADAPAELDLVQQAHASIIRTTVDWYRIASRRPANAADSFDPAYNFNDLDALVRSAAQRGIEVMITIWGTPKWANGGKTPNYAPTRLADLQSFARAVADRYSGRHAGFPVVRYYSVWNEPNLGIFLSPAFDAKGQIISPRIYAGIYKAAYAGIKTGNRSAQVAIGETSALGRDHPLKGAPISIAPGTFARLLAQQPGLRFDAYAEHPYPTRPNLPPMQAVRWPNVTLRMLPKFEQSLNSWFHRTVPVWVTEYGYQTRPPNPLGVSPATQSAYLSQVLRKLRADANVQMFIWFVFRDSPTALWKSGLYTQSGAMKPAYDTFSSLANTIDGQTVQVRAGAPPLITLPVPLLAFFSDTGEAIGVNYRVFDGSRLIALGQPQVPLGTNDAVSFVADFTPVAGKTYTLQMDAGDVHGNHVLRTFALVTPGKATAKQVTRAKSVKHR